MVTPQQIKNEISSRPPLQREEAGKHYEGINVTWQLKFRQCFYPESNNKSLLTIHGMSGNADVAFQVNPDKYPELKVLHTGEDFRVSGTISEVQNGYLIVLINVTLKFLDQSIRIPDQSENRKTPEKTIIHGDFVQGNKYTQNGDKNSIKTETKENNKKWYEKPFGLILIPIVVGIIIYTLTEGKLPKIIQWFRYSNSTQTSLTTDSKARSLNISVFQLVADTDFSGSPLLGIQQKWKGYAGLISQDEKAYVMNYGDAGGGEKTWVIFKSSDLYNGNSQYINCIFNSEWRQRILLLKKDDSNSVTVFTGTIRGDLDQGGVPVLENCWIK